MTLPQPSTRVPVVWLVNEGGHPYSKAERFGRILPITTENINPFNPDRMMVNIAGKLRLAHEDDYVLISGVAILNALTIAMWLVRFSKVEVLQWSQRKKDYEHLTISAESVARMAAWPKPTNSDTRA